MATRRDDHDAGRAPACRDCGTTGGWRRTDRANHPTYRERGLCKTCHTRHWRAGTLQRYPSTAVPYKDTPDIPTGFIHPWQLGIRPDQHAVLPGGHELAVWLVAEAEAFAGRWLALHDPAAA